MRISITRLFAVGLLAAFASCKEGKKQAENIAPKDPETKNMNVIFVGSYTRKEGHVDGKAEGIYTLYQNQETGELKNGKTVAKLTNPSFVKTSKDGKYLFAVSELGPGGDAESGFVYSYKITENDSLEELSRISTEGFAPAHVTIDESGKYVLVANYSGGVVMLYKLAENGILKKQQRIDLENPEGSHAHSITVSADNEHAYIADLGNDKIWIYDFNESEGKLTPGEQAFVDLENGAGPRHFTLSKKGRFAYSINELNSSVSAFKVLENGGLELIQNISSLPEGFSENNSGADIHLHPSGKFLYASNRGHNSIVSYEVDTASGELGNPNFTSTLGKTPRNFAISPDGAFLYAANQDSGNISVYKIGEDGTLEQKGEPVAAKTPVSLEFSNR
ncbi:lactonase family protein [Salinimicrobium tongyeongense]|uniref:Lactonase family protein n=1 Tax=Salinimicrobium tongyeongense TaxID=2809707 RepID=A0ABY6NQD5_9FLAO|nr:lactonase family protein [Salinimicrobium tongyeongense]UZH55115.1 lactonase family protein [Salinimicrobium tongyeongense]